MLTLLDRYFKIGRHDGNAGSSVFQVSLLSGFEVYKGHFPDNPVSPGVCNIQMIKECAELMMGERLFLETISFCRFSAMVTPQTTPHLEVHLTVEPLAECYVLQASIVDTSKTYVELKAGLSVWK